MEEISNPRDGCVSMFVVQVDDLLLDDLFSFWATVGIVV